MKITSTESFEKYKSEILTKRDSGKKTIVICSETSCHAKGCTSVTEKFQQEIQEKSLAGKVHVKKTGCHGFCEMGPLVVVEPEMICYVLVKPTDVPEIISKTVIGGEVIERLLYKEGDTRITHEQDIPFYKHQTKLIFANNRKIGLGSIEDYIAVGGYSGLAKAFKMAPEQIIEEIKKSGLRGRGGGGFPTGRKWESVRATYENPKYVIVNCDEGDPGAYMDRSLMEGNPHSVIEGLIIGAYAIGSNQGWIYVREEYPLAVENVHLALKQARELGFLGKNILGSGFDFDVKVFRGAGAFVSGESSELIKSLEGKVGEPIPKYIHMSEKGLHDKPTALNNVETWANVPFIINKGADWYRTIGSENSKGTKIFSLVGNVKNTGLVEVPMGITLRDIIFKIGGGIKGDKAFKGVQTGGPSGGVIPTQYIDTPVDFDALTKLGSMMGSGGMIVMDENTCMVDVSKYFLNFLKDESCGKCVPCREGIKQELSILERITEGKGVESDLKALEDISRLMADASLCALGTSAPNPVLTTIKYFREEYLTHIRDKKCPAGVCKALITYTINEKCTGCGLCPRVCPTSAIKGDLKRLHALDQAKCIKCGACFDVCNFKAIDKR